MFITLDICCSPDNLDDLKDLLRKHNIKCTVMVEVVQKQVYMYPMGSSGISLK